MRRAANPIPENDVAKPAMSSAGKAPAVRRKRAKSVGNDITCPQSTTPPQLCSSTTLQVCGTYEATIKDVTVVIRNQGDTADVPNGALQHAAMAGGRWTATFYSLHATAAGAFDRVKVCWYEAHGILAKQDTVKIRVGAKGTNCSASCAAATRRKRKATGPAAR